MATEADAETRNPLTDYGQTVLVLQGGEVRQHRNQQQIERNYVPVT